MPLLEITNYNKYGHHRKRVFYNPKSSIGFNPKGFGSGINIRIFKYTHKHPILPPSLITLRSGKYIVPGWVKVLPETTLDDIVWDKPKLKSEEIKTWEFKSSSSSSIYKVEFKNGTYRCNCPGFFRVRDKVKGCKHIQSARNQNQID